MEELFPKRKAYKFNKTNSRSVLGSMNDFKNQIRVQIWHKGELSKTYDLIIHWINQCPMSALNYGMPGRVLKESLESRFQEKYN